MSAALQFFLCEDTLSVYFIDRSHSFYVLAYIQWTPVPAYIFFMRQLTFYSVPEVCFFQVFASLGSNIVFTSFTNTFFSSCKGCFF